MHQENGIWVSTEDLNRDEKLLQSANQEFSIETLAEEESPWVSSRRDFLKFLGFGVGAATLAASCEIPVRKAIPYVTKPDDLANIDSITRQNLIWPEENRVKIRLQDLVDVKVKRNFDPEGSATKPYSITKTTTNPDGTTETYRITVVGSPDLGDAN